MTYARILARSVKFEKSSLSIGLYWIKRQTNSTNEKKIHFCLCTRDPTVYTVGEVWARSLRNQNSILLLNSFSNIPTQMKMTVKPSRDSAYDSMAATPSDTDQKIGTYDANAPVFEEQVWVKVFIKIASVLKLLKSLTENGNNTRVSRESDGFTS